MRTPAKPAAKTAMKTPARPAARRPPPKTPAPPTARAIPESCLAGGTLWRMSGKNGVAYVRDAALAVELLCAAPKDLDRAAMAVYYDKKGRAFAWQVRFDADRWAELEKRLG